MTMHRSVVSIFFICFFIAFTREYLFVILVVSEVGIGALAIHGFSHRYRLVVKFGSPSERLIRQLKGAHTSQIEAI